MCAKVIRKITPVVLAGLNEAEALSLTRKGVPRSFFKFLSRKSFFQKSVLRGISFGDPVIVCEERYIAIVREQLGEIGVRPRAILTEPEHRGGAVSVAIAAFYLKNLNECMLVMHSGLSVSSGEEYSRGVLDIAPYVEDSFAFIGGHNTGDLGLGYIDYDLNSKNEGVFLVNSLMLNRDDDVKGKSCAFTGDFMVRPKIYLDGLKSSEVQAYRGAERSYYVAQERDGVIFPSTEEFLSLLHVSLGSVLTQLQVRSYVRVLQCECGGARLFPWTISRNGSCDAKRA
jgi:mannose-1-phosphate guanylyltransferase